MKNKKKKKKKNYEEKWTKKIHAEIRSIRFFMPCVRVCVSEFCRMYLWVSRIEFCCGIFFTLSRASKISKKKLKKLSIFIFKFFTTEIPNFINVQKLSGNSSTKNVSCLSRCSQSCLNCCCCCIDNKKLMKIDWKKFFNQPQNSKRDFVFFVVNVFFSLLLASFFFCFMLFHLILFIWVL